METLEFKTFQRAESSLVSLGTISSIVGQTGSISLIQKNFSNPDKRVAVLLNRADGTSTVVACSTAVSAGLRNKSISIGNLLTFEVLKGETGAFISMPAGGSGLVTYKVAEITAKPFVLSQLSVELAIAL